MTTHMDPDAFTRAPSEPPDGRPPRPGRAVLFVLLAVIALLAAALVVVVVRDDNSSVTTGAGTTASTTPATSASSATTSPTVSPTVSVPVDFSTAVWPADTSSVRYTEPTAAAMGFAVDFLGFREPVVGPFMQGDTRSGEVEIRPDSTGPVTTVFVRQLDGSDSWWVLGAATANIQISTPSALADISSPVHLSGTSTAFEANVRVRIHADGQQTPLADTFVMGGSMGEMGPFDANVEFSAPHAAAGSIVMFTVSMKDGSVREASVLRVHFGS